MFEDDSSCLRSDLSSLYFDVTSNCASNNRRFEDQIWITDTVSTTFDFSLALTTVDLDYEYLDVQKHCNQVQDIEIEAVTDTYSD